MAFSGIRSLRRRLAVMSAVLILPLALIVGVNVAITYSKVREALDAVPMTAATASRQAIYATLVGAARFAVAVGDGVAHGGGSRDYLERSLAHNPGYLAIRVRVGAHSELAVRPSERPQADALAGKLDDLQVDDPDLNNPGFPARAWFRPLPMGDRRVFYVRVAYEVDRQPADVIIVVGDDLMQRVLDSIDDQSGAMVTLLDRHARPLAASTSEGWLPAPAGFDLSAEHGAMPGVGRDGRKRIYGVRRLAGPHAYVVAAVDANATSGLRAQLPIAFLVPIFGLALISLAFMRALKTNVLDWVFGLDRDVRRSRNDAAARAIVSARMPIEIENVARSFNEVLDARNTREAELSRALAHNRTLTRELHHRVKNSLQMVQSYLALGAREASGPERSALAAAQCRAYILSSAYRRALAEGEMRPFEIDAFLADVASYSSEVLKAPRQRVDRAFQTHAHAGIDEALPLGMIVVELIEKGLRAHGAGVVSIRVEAAGAGRAKILAHVDSAAGFPPPARLLVGLLRQIGAAPAPAPAGGLAYVLDIAPPAMKEARDPTHAMPSGRASGNSIPPPSL